MSEAMRSSSESHGMRLKALDKEVPDGSASRETVGTRVSENRAEASSAAVIPLRTSTVPARRPVRRSAGASMSVSAGMEEGFAYEGGANASRPKSSMGMNGPSVPRAMYSPNRISMFAAGTL